MLASFCDPPLFLSCGLTLACNESTEDLLNKNHLNCKKLTKVVFKRIKDAVSQEHLHSIYEGELGRLKMIMLQER